MKSVWVPLVPCIHKMIIYFFIHHFFNIQVKLFPCSHFICLEKCLISFSEQLVSFIFRVACQTKCKYLALGWGACRTECIDSFFLTFPAFLSVLKAWGVMIEIGSCFAVSTYLFFPLLMYCFLYNLYEITQSLFYFFLKSIRKTGKYIISSCSC